MNPSISRVVLKQLIESGEPHTLIEALPKKYYEQEHLPGAINIPHDEMPASAARLIPNKDGKVVIYCANAECRNSRMAAEALRGMGYTNVYEYTDGKKDWKEAGLPLEKGGGTI